MITDGADIYVEAGDLLGSSGNGSGYAPQTDVWPNIEFINLTPTPTATPTPTPAAGTPTQFFIMFCGTSSSTPTATPDANLLASLPPSPLDVPATSTVGLVLLSAGILSVMLFKLWSRNGDKRPKNTSARS